MVDPQTIGERVPEISVEDQVARLRDAYAHLDTFFHVEGERQTEIQVAGLRGQCSPSANNNEQELSQLRLHDDLL